MKDWLISHRGAQKDAKENTAQAYKDATKYPVSYIELDLHTTKDGVVICNHDFKIGDLDINLCTYKELKIAKPELTTFDEAIKDINGKKPIIVEIKPTGTAKNIMAILNKHKGWKITSFKAEVIKELIDLGIDKKRLFLLQKWYFFNFRHIQKAIRLGVYGIGVRNWVMTPRIYRRAIYKDLEIYTYVVNKPVQAKLFRYMYPKLSMCTDRPDKLQSIK